MRALRVGVLLGRIGIVHGWGGGVRRFRLAGLTTLARVCLFRPL